MYITDITYAMKTIEIHFPIWYQLGFRSTFFPSHHSNSYMTATTAEAATQQPKFHYAFGITNMKSIIPITLDNNSSLYLSWSALFQVQACVHNVLDHIITSIDEKEKQTAEATKKNDPGF